MTSKNKTSVDPAKLEISNFIGEALIALYSEPWPEAESFDAFEILEKPPEVLLGDFSMPCFSLARPLRKKPQLIAEEIKGHIEAKLGDSVWIEKIKIEGAFLNFFISAKALADAVISTVRDGSYFETLRSSDENHSTKVMVEYSQPNTHKEFHVGHGRNACLGDSLCRLFLYNGYEVVAANYFGDEGAHIAKCLWHVERSGETPPDPNPEPGKWYGQHYVKAVAILDEASEEDAKIYNEQVSKILHAIETKKGAHYETWKKSRVECLEDFKRTYQWLDVHFDHDFFESEFAEESQSLVDAQLKKGFFAESEGAIGIDLSDHKLGFCMVRKSDGNIPYMTRDIALAHRKFNDFGVDRSIYVVASEQNFHFQQLFKTLELMGVEQAEKCYHLSYGMVVRPDGKMSSRKGNSITFDTLQKEMTRELSGFLDRYKDEWSDEELAETAKRLSVGAIRYGMLQTDPVRDITFDIKDWLSFEGNTGPYLMYTYARCRSIIRKAADAEISGDGLNSEALTTATEKEILRDLYDFNSVTMQACESYRPSTMGQYLFGLCKTFNRYYTEVSVLKEENAEIRASRVALLDAFSLVLKKGMELLGMTPPDRM